MTTVREWIELIGKTMPNVWVNIEMLNGLTAKRNTDIKVADALKEFDGWLDYEVVDICELTGPKCYKIIYKVEGF